MKFEKQRAVAIFGLSVLQFLKRASSSTWIGLQFPGRMYGLNWGFKARRPQAAMITHT